MHCVKGLQRLADDVQMPTRYGVERSGVESFGPASLAHAKRQPPLPSRYADVSTRRTEHASIEGLARHLRSPRGEKMRNTLLGGERRSTTSLAIFVQGRPGSR